MSYSYPLNSMFYANKFGFNYDNINGIDNINAINDNDDSINNLTFSDYIDFSLRLNMNTISMNSRLFCQNYKKIFIPTNLEYNCNYKMLNNHISIKEVKNEENTVTNNDWCYENREVDDYYRELPERKRRRIDNNMEYCDMV